jgi:hypothetical protein
MAGLACAALAGCANHPNTAPPNAVDEISDITVLSGQTAARWGTDPAPDGLEVMLYLFNRFTSNQPVTGRGAIEFDMYDGTLTAQSIASARPFSSTRTDLPKLQGTLVRTAFGWGYSLRLPWGANVPTSGSVTLQVKYTSPAGREMFSAPITVAMSPH